MSFTTLRSSFLRYLNVVGKVLGILVLHILAAVAGERILAKWRAGRRKSTATSPQALPDPALPTGRTSQSRLSTASGFILTFLRIFLLLTAGLILLVAIGAYGEFRYLLHSFESNVGMNSWLAKSLAVIFLLAYVYGSIMLFSIRSHRRKRGFLVLVITLLSFNGLMYSMTRSHYFHPSSGTAQKHYSLTSDGRYRLFDHDGFDPSTGAALRPLTPEIANRIEAGTFSGFSEASDTVKFFDPHSGTALVWYHRGDDGSYELFNSEGYHPRYQTPLQPMTRDAARDYDQWRAKQRALSAEEEKERAAQARRENETAQRAQLEKKQQAQRKRLLNYQALMNHQGQKRVLLGVKGSGTAEGISTFMSSLVTLAQESGRKPVTGVFREEFYEADDFQDLLGGDATSLERLRLMATEDVVFIGQVSFEEMASDRFEGLITVRATFNFACFARQQQITKMRVLTATGPGFNVGDAAQRAAERLVAKVRAEGGCF